MDEGHPSGRAYVRPYQPVRRADDYAFLLKAVERAGGRIVWSSDTSVAPFYVSAKDASGGNVGLMIYAFRANKRIIRNRPSDEHRLQMRYGDVNDRAWREADHPIGFDPARSDVTLVLGIHPEEDLLIGLDPLLYDPLPMGMSVFFKDDDLQGDWSVWERVNRSGTVRTDTRSSLGVETLMAFVPERLFDYVRFERQAQALRLDPSLRYRAALRSAKPEVDITELHQLEKEFDLSGHEILELIAERSRLSMAVRGGVAEHHMGKQLEADPEVLDAKVGHQEGPPDFFVTLRDGRKVTVEVKNAAPTTYANGDPKVEVQKTRASKGDPTSRLYRPDAFDVLATCLYGPTGSWDFRFKLSEDLERHEKHVDCIRPMQRVDESWSPTLVGAIN